jgi:hypothetical protein
LKSAACDISANWKIMTSATGSPSGRATAALRVVWPAPSIRVAMLAAGSSVAKHTRSIFFDMRRPFRPLVSLQRVVDRR